MEKYVKLAKIYPDLGNIFLLDCIKNVLIAGLRVAFLSLAIIVINGLFFGDNAKALQNGLNDAVLQVRTAESPKVYFLDHTRGLKKAYISADGYLSYGNKWSDIKVVSQADLDQWYDAYLIKIKNNPGVYFIYNGKKALIASAAQFEGLGFDWADIITVTQADFNSYSLVGLDYLLSTVPAEDSPVESAEQGLGAYLNPASPKKGFVSINTTDNLAAVFNLEANSDSPIKISELTFNLKGVFSDGLIKDIYVINDTGNDLGIKPHWSGRKATFSLRNNPFTLQPGETRQLAVFIDLAGDEANNGQAYFVSLESSASIKADAPVIGAFPLSSAEQSILAVSGLLGKVKASEESLSGYNSKPIIGSTEQPIIKFSLSELSGNEDVYVKYIGLEAFGSADSKMINNFKLKNKAGKILAQTKEMNNENIVRFSVNNYKLEKISSEIFTVYADILDGDGEKYNFNLAGISLSGASSGLNFSADLWNLDETQTIKREFIGVVAKDLKTNTKVFSRQKGVIVGNFEIRNNNKKITLQSVELELYKNYAAPALSGTVYLVNYNTGELYGYVEGRSLSSGRATVRLDPVSLAPKTNLTLTLITDIPANTYAGDYYQIVLNKVSYTGQNGVTYGDEIKAPGAKLNIAKSGLYAYPNHDLAGMTYVMGEGGVSVAEFIMEVSAGEDIVINGLTVAQGDTSGAITYTNGFSNLRAYINGRHVGQVIFEPTGATFNISGFNYRLKNGSRAELSIVADTTYDLRVSQTQMVLNDLAAVSYSSGIPASISGLPIPSYPVYFDISALELTAISGGNITADTNENLVASFSVTNMGIEDIKLKEVEVHTSGDGFTSSMGFYNLTIKETVKGHKVGKVNRPVAGANILLLGNQKIKAGETLVFNLYVDADRYVSTGSFQVYFTDLIAQGTVTKVIPEIIGDPTGPVMVNVN